MVKHAVEVGADEVEVTAEAEQAWIDRLKAGDRRFAADPDCTPATTTTKASPTTRRHRSEAGASPRAPSRTSSTSTRALVGRVRRSRIPLSDTRDLDPRTPAFP